MGRREENKQKKREKLEAEGLRLFLERGYDGASIEQIAAASGVARGTFYLYFDDKLTLFETLVDRWFRVVLELLRDVDARIARTEAQPELVNIYGEMATNIAMTAIAHGEALLLAFRELRRVGEAGDALRSREAQLLEVVTELTRKAADRELIKVSDPALATLVIYGAVEKITYLTLSGEQDLDDPLAMAQEVMTMLSRALDLPV